MARPTTLLFDDSQSARIPTQAQTAEHTTSYHNKRSFGILYVRVLVHCLQCNRIQVSTIALYGYNIPYLYNITTRNTEITTTEFKNLLKFMCHTHLCKKLQTTPMKYSTGVCSFCCSIYGVHTLSGGVRDRETGECTFVLFAQPASLFFAILSLCPCES